MDGSLEKEFDYYLAHQEDFVAKYDGRVIVIKNHDILGVYDNELAAVTATQEHHTLGTFLIQRISAGDEAYSATFHSRVTFS